jgi:hypothetical protein
MRQKEMPKVVFQLLSAFSFEYFKKLLFYYANKFAVTGANEFANT